jgi:16S rRNA (guanine527-N7)-methyltransferase
MPTIDQQIADYLALLSKWNKAYNLTAITDPEKMYTHHILDSLAIAPFLHGEKILDVGSGAGLPGIPLALTYPDKQFYLLDSNGKKTRFVLHVIQTLNITNVQVIHERVENFKPDFCFDTITSRAFSSLHDFVTKTQHLLGEHGIWLAMKGAHPTEELKELDPTKFAATVQPLQISELNAERCVVKITAAP